MQRKDTAGVGAGRECGGRAHSEVEIESRLHAPRLLHDVVTRGVHRDLAHPRHKVVEVDPRPGTRLARVDLTVADYVVAIDRYRPAVADLRHQAGAHAEHRRPSRPLALLGVPIQTTSIAATRHRRPYAWTMALPGLPAGSRR